MGRDPILDTLMSLQKSNQRHTEKGVLHNNPSVKQFIKELLKLYYSTDFNAIATIFLGLV
jgi:hypothetical protein